MATMHLQPVLGGMVRSAAIQSQSPFSTPNCMNVRPRDQIGRRTRIGSRPPLKKSYVEQLGSGNPINLLRSVRPATSTQGSWADEFQSLTMSTNWALWSGNTATPQFGPETVRSLGEGLYSAMYIPETTGNTIGAIYRVMPPGMDTTKSYRIRARGIPTRVGNPVGTYYHAQHYDVYLFADPTTPDHLTNGVRVRMTGTGVPNAHQISRILIDQYLAGTPTNKLTTDFADFGAAVDWAVTALEIDILVNYLGATSADVILYLNGTLMAGVNCTLSTSAHHRFGVGLVERDETGFGYAAYDRFAVVYQKTSDGILAPSKLVAGSNSVTYIENQAGGLTAATGVAVPRADLPLESVDYLGNLYLADWSVDRAASTDGAISGGTFTTFDSATYPDWTTLGIDVNTDVLLLTAGGTNTIFKSYSISSVAAGSLTIASPMSTSVESNVTFRIARCPKKIDVDALANGLYLASSGLGFVPLGCKIIGVFQERIVLTGDYRNSGAIYMSRMGDPTDWDFGADAGDIGGAWSTATQLQSGQIGEDITSFMAWRDDFCIFGCENSTWIMRGNPRAGGIIDNLSQIIGPLSASAWCPTPDQGLVTLTRDGLYAISAGGMVSLSREKLPEELINIDPRLYTITMAYDVIDRGVHIYLTPIETAGGVHFWFDLENRGFWPVDMPDSMQPWRLAVHELPGAIDRRVLLGGRDGYVRHCDETALTDDGTAMESFVDFAPLRLGEQPGANGTLIQLDAVMDAGSADVEWSLHPGDTPELCLTADAQESGSWGAGLAYTENPRVEANSLRLRIASTSAPWAIELLSLERQPAGVTRKA